MKIYNCCPICTNISKTNINREIYGLGELAEIEIDELFTKVTDHRETQGLLSVCMNCRLVYNKRFYDETELSYIYEKAYYAMEQRIKELPEFVYGNEYIAGAQSKRIYEKVKFLEHKYKRKISNISAL